MWRGASFAVLVLDLSVLYFSLSDYRYLGDGGTDRREILHDVHVGPGQISSYGGRNPRNVTFGA